MKPYVVWLPIHTQGSSPGDAALEAKHEVIPKGLASSILPVVVTDSLTDDPRAELQAGRVFFMVLDWGHERVEVQPDDDACSGILLGVAFVVLLAAVVVSSVRFLLGL